jgi:hypothetical protein
MNTANQKKLIYICAPLKGDIAVNIANAREYCKAVIKAGMVPIAPHVMLDGILNDDIPEERQAALEMGIELVNCCDELWIFTSCISQGMKNEIDRAKRVGIPTKNVLFCNNPEIKQLQTRNAILHKALELMAKDFYDESDDHAHPGPEGLASDYIQWAEQK